MNARVIERAVRFIRERLAHHNLKISLEIGEHLFVNVYKGRRELFHRGNRWATDTIARIADDERVDVHEDVLHMCIHCHLLVKVHGAHAPKLPLPPLTAWKLDEMYCLEDDPESLVAVASWAAKNRASIELIEAAAQLVGPYMRAGGKLEDLLIDGPGVDTPYRRVMRMLDVLEHNLERDGLAPSVRARTLEALDRAITALC